METFLSKLSQYNIVNYLFPGIVFSLVIKNIGTYSLVSDNYLLLLFLYYFIGLVISRIGSLCFEPLLQKLHFIKYQPYDKYVKAEKNDEKIAILLEVNNMYRTLISLIVNICIFKILQKLFIYYSLNFIYLYVGILFMLLVIFLFSYKKQTSYIYKRIDCIINFKEKE